MESEILQFVNRAEKAELEIQKLVEELEVIEKGVTGRGSTASVIDNSSSKSSNQGKYKAIRVFLRGERDFQIDTSNS